MRCSAVFAFLASVTVVVAARSPQHVGKSLPERDLVPRWEAPTVEERQSSHAKRASSPYLNANSESMVIYPLYADNLSQTY